MNVGIAIVFIILFCSMFAKFREDKADKDKREQTEHSLEEKCDKIIKLLEEIKTQIKT